MPILMVNDRFDALMGGTPGKFNFNVNDGAIDTFQKAHGKIFIASGGNIGQILSGNMKLDPSIEMAFIHKDYDELPGQSSGNVMSFMAEKLLEFFLKKGIPPIFTSGEYWSGCKDLMHQGVHGYCRNDMKDILLIGANSQELKKIRSRETLLMVDKSGEHLEINDIHRMEGLILREEMKARVEPEGATSAERTSKKGLE